MRKWQVTRNEGDIKLVSFLRSKFGEAYTARQLKRAIEGNLCVVNHLVERFATYTLNEGDLVILYDHEIKNLPPKKFKKESKRILYEDDVLMVYDKPAGVTSDGTGLAGIFHPLKLVHRLDRETTGAIIYAKSEDVKQEMISLFRKKLVTKVYLALVDGVPKQTSGTIDNSIGRVKGFEGQALWGVVHPSRGRHAITSWRCDKKGKNAALLRCFPETGRTHQIRIHLKELGHPILGDYHYNKGYRCSYHAKRCMLHAHEVAFPHPSTGKLLKVFAPIPEDFQQAMSKVVL